MGIILGRIAFAAALLVAAFAAVGPAAAQNAKAATFMEHCKADLDRFCAGIQPGGGRLRPCMKENFQNFSEGCKATIQGMGAQKR